MNQNKILNIIQVIFLNQKDKNGMKTHIIIIWVLMDPLMEECRVQSLVHRRVNWDSVHAFLQILWFSFFQWLFSIKNVQLCLSSVSTGCTKCMFNLNKGQTVSLIRKHLIWAEVCLLYPPCWWELGTPRCFLHSCVERAHSCSLLFPAAVEERDFNCSAWHFTKQEHTLSLVNFDHLLP